MLKICDNNKKLLGQGIDTKVDGMKAMHCTKPSKSLAFIKAPPICNDLNFISDNDGTGNETEGTCNCGVDKLTSIEILV